MHLGEGLAGWFGKLATFGLEAATGRFYSSYDGDVEDNKDPSQLGRVKVLVHATGRTEPHAQWAYPSSFYAGRNYGGYFPPEEGDNVWAFYEFGDPQIPNIGGSYWTDEDNAVPADPATSLVPQEFKAHGDDLTPTKKGIKSKRGHVLAFEDKEGEEFVELSTGSNRPVGSVAFKKNRLLLSDAEALIYLATLGEGDEDPETADTHDGTGTETARRRHELLMRDTADPDDKQIRLRTSGSADDQRHSFVLNDTTPSARLETHDKHFFVISDAEDYAQISTVNGYSFRVDEQNKKIEAVLASEGYDLTLDANNGFVRLQRPDQSLLMDGDGTTLSDQTGNRIAFESAGDLEATVGGNESRQVAGGFEEEIVGSSQITVQGAVQFDFGSWIAQIQALAQILVTGALTIQSNAAITITAAGVTTVDGSQLILGAGASRRIVLDGFFTQYLAHTHNTTIAGAPTGPPITGVAISPNESFTTKAAAT